MGAQTLIEFPRDGSCLANLPLSIAAGPDGALWFTEPTSDGIGRMGRMTLDGQLSEFSIPSIPLTIVAGHDGALWLSALGSNGPALARITTSGSYSEILLPAGSNFQSSFLSRVPLVVTGDGSVWVAAGRLVRVSSSGSVTTFPIDALELVAGAFDHVWFVGAGPGPSSTQLGDISPDGTVKLIPGFPNEELLGPLALGPDGNLWVATNGSVSRITPTGEQTAFSIPGLQFDPTVEINGIIRGPDGNIWLTSGFEFCSNRVCETTPSRLSRITPTGIITQFDLAEREDPNQLTIGPDGNLWFTEKCRIGEFVPSIGCLSDSHSQCLSANRFRAQVSWNAVAQESAGLGTAMSLTPDTAAFWFFSPNNIEVVVKVVDGAAVNGHFWIFIGALSDVEYHVTVTDSVTGDVREYSNPQGTLRSVADTAAFPAAD